MRALVRLSPPDLPRLDAIGIDGAVLAFALGITTLIGLGIGCIPALQAARSDPQRDLQHGSCRATGGRGQASAALVVAEVALAVVLLVSSGLLRAASAAVRSDAARRLDLLTMQVTPRASLDGEGATSRFFAARSRRRHYRHGGASPPAA